MTHKFYFACPVTAAILEQAENLELSTTDNS